MAKGGTYTFTLKKKELVAVIAGLLVTYVMVFLLGYTLGKEATPTVSQVAIQEYRQETSDVEQEKPPELEEEPVPQVPQQSVAVASNASRKEKPKVEVEVPVKPVKTPPANSPLRFFVQAGAFSDYARAKELKNRIKQKGYKVQIMKVGNLYKVLIGPFTTQDDAVKAKKKLIRDAKIYGYIVKY